MAGRPTPHPGNPEPLPIFQTADDGRVLAVRNWRHRSRQDDALIAEPLDEEEAAHYRRCKSDGMDEQRIFDDLFCAPPGETVAIPIQDLTRAQAMSLLREAAGDSLVSLHRMRRRDLLALVRALRRAGER